MLIGIKQTPQKGALPAVEVFYCGNDGVQFRKKHAALITKDNPEGTKFFSVVNPLLVPLQNVVHSTEDHPDIVRANEHRAALAEKAKVKVATIQPELTDAEKADESEAAAELEKSSGIRKELLAKPRGELLAIGTEYKLPAEVLAKTKVNIVDALMETAGYKK